MTNRLSLQRAGQVTLSVLAAIALGAGGCTTDLQIDGSGGSAAQTTTSQTSTGSGPSCTSFPDDAPLGNVTFTVKNNQAAPIYITGPWCTRRFTIAASPGAAFQEGERPTSEGTCEHPIPPPLDCLGDSATLIEPGGTLQLEWSGLVYAKPTLASGCPAPADPQSLECYQGRAPESGTLEVRVDISPTAENCVGTQNCSATGTLFFAKKTFTYPGETQVQVDVD
jgi:hypothetical protein